LKLPGLANAYVPQAKVVDYLLNPEHTGGGKDKAQFLVRFGFTIERWEVLATALLDHAHAYEVISSIATPQGVNYAIDGRLITPDGRYPLMRTVWTVDTDSIAPRFVTTYPV
jgi:hypothetical protein